MVQELWQKSTLKVADIRRCHAGRRRDPSKYLCTSQNALSFQAMALENGESRQHSVDIRKSGR
jgi:hypothetical protein